MRISERICTWLAGFRPPRALRLAGGAGAGLGLLAMAAAGAPHALAADSGGLSLDIVRQFHSYTPGRQSAAPRARAGRKAGEKALQRARAAWRKKKYKTARKYLLKAVKAGNVEAAWYLAHMYRTGLGGGKDHARALKHYRQVARHYDPDIRDRRWLVMTLDAVVRVADYLRTGIDGKGRGRNVARAFQLYNMAAAHGHPAAYYGLAVISLRGKGSPRRKRMAVAWLKRAAGGGHVPAARKLALLAEKGLPGVLAPDPVSALAWRMIAAWLAGRPHKAFAADSAADPNIAKARAMARHFLISIGRMPPAPAAAKAPAAPEREIPASSTMPPR